MSGDSLPEGRVRVRGNRAPTARYGYGRTMSLLVQVGPLAAIPRILGPHGGHSPRQHVRHNDAFLVPDFGQQLARGARDIAAPAARTADLVPAAAA